MNTARSCFVSVVCICGGLLASSVGHAWDNQYTAYQDRLMVPPSAHDVRQIVANKEVLHLWHVVEEKPGQVTVELDYVRDRARIVANVLYDAGSIQLQLVSATPTDCPKPSSCKVAEELIDRRMIGLRRNIASELLNAVIVDAGGTVVTDTELKARFRPTEQSLASPSGTEIARAAEDLYRGTITGEQYFDLAAERLVQLMEAYTTADLQKENDNTLEWLGLALGKGGSRYRDVLASVNGKLKADSLHRKYTKLLTTFPASDTTQYVAGTATLPTFVENYAEELQSSNPLFVQNAAIMMREAGVKRPELYEMAAKRIEADRHDSNRYAASASAHLCRFLITSNDPRYADFYRDLLAMSANKSLRRAAKDGLVMLGLIK